MGPFVDRDVEDQALRHLGSVGRGGAMGNLIFPMDYSQLPPEARDTILRITNGGPFLYPFNDGRPFENRFGDAVGARFLEFTVPTPGVQGRGRRRIVAHEKGVLYFTACHYDRVRGAMTVEERRAQTAQIDEQWRNGFYIITGMNAALRAQISAGLQLLPR
jgi:hypothetical protein